MRQGSVGIGCKRPARYRNDGAVRHLPQNPFSLVPVPATPAIKGSALPKDFISPIRRKRAASGRLRGLEVKEGPVSTEVMIETAAGEKIVSSITTTCAKNLGLKVGGKAYAIIKASNVMIGIED